MDISQNGDEMDGKATTLVEVQMDTTVAGFEAANKPSPEAEKTVQTKVGSLYQPLHFPSVHEICL